MNVRTDRITPDPKVGQTWCQTFPSKGLNFIRHGITVDERANSLCRQHASVQEAALTPIQTVPRRMTLTSKSGTWLAYFAVAPLWRFLIGPHASVDAQVIHDVRAMTVTANRYSANQPHCLPRRDKNIRHGTSARQSAQGQSVVRDQGV
jgi:hypothetical protein